MSAIRPLATIAMLMVLGVFLWTRINAPDLRDETEPELEQLDPPPIVAVPGPESGGPPPAFSPAEPTNSGEEEIPEFDFGPASQAGTGSDIEPLAKGETAAMPELPPLPSDVPMAQYGDSSHTDAAEDKPAADAMAGEVPPIDSPMPPVPPVPDSSEPAGASPYTADSLAGMNDTAPLDTDSTGLPADSTAPADPQVSREFSGEASAFVAAQPAIEAALERGELEEAHRLLSQWYGDPSLPTEEQEAIAELLSQLAGTVIYSTEHRLEPPHRVQPGETLETIAQQYNVPWQLLAKINGVPQPSAVTPGQELKVIRGPFSAVVVPGSNRLALMVADRYAGQFGVKVEGMANNEGEWVVTQKQMPMGDSKHLVLEAVGGNPGGPQLVLGPPSDTAPSTAGAIRVAPKDQEDLFDILSIGSRVLIRK